MTRPAARALAIVVLSLLTYACSRADEPPPHVESRADRYDARDWLASMEHAHRGADEAMGTGNVDRARELLRGGFDTLVPPGMASEDARVVRQDLAFRLAELDLDAGNAVSAIEWADRGLALGEADDVFTANLLIVRGRAREAAGGDREAVSDYFRALEINEALLRRTLDGTPPEGP
jgi:hypothetical protein